MITIITSVLSCLVIILGYTTFNLLKKQEKAEDILISYKTYIDKLKQQIEFSNKRINELNAKGTFTSDDEIGWFFKEIQTLQALLNQFKMD
jgi:hypothetical protein